MDEQALIEDWIRRKYRTAPREGLFADEKDLAAAYRRLLRAGFRTGEIVRVAEALRQKPGPAGRLRAARGSGRVNLHDSFHVQTGLLAKANSSTTRPPIRCSWMMRSSTSGVAE